jgi:outer membrane protein
MKYLLLFTTAACAFAQQPLHLTLADAEKLAIANHPALSAQKYVAAAAAEIVKEYRAGYAPAFSANFTAVGADDGSRLAAGGLNNPVVYNRIGSGVTVSQMVFDFGRTGNLVASAKLRAEAQDKNYDATKADVLLETERAYFSLLRAQAVLKVAEDTVRARQLIVDQVSALAKSQMKSTLDVSFAKVNLAEAELALAAAQNELKSGRVRLTTAMGIPGEENFTVDDTGTPEPLPDQVKPLVLAALRDRPDLASLRFEQSAAERNVKAERALAFPSVGLVASAGLVPAAVQTVPGQYGAIGVNVNLPVFNGGLFGARRAEAEMRARATGQNVKFTENRIARDVHLAYNAAMTAYERIGLSSQMLEQARLALELAQRRYDLGLSSMIELSQAQLNLTSAQIASASAKYDYQSQRSVLNYQLGLLR